MLILILFVLFIFFIVLKKDMLIKMFNLNTNQSALEFKKELEKTGDAVVERLEEKITELEYLLAEADNKIEKLNELFIVYQGIPVKEDKIHNDNQQEYKMNTDFSRQLALAAYKSSQTKSETVQHLNNIDIDNSKDKQKQVLLLLQQGQNEVDIAKNLGLGLAEVRLLMQLNKNK